MYSSKEERDSSDYISLDDVSKQFPKWMETWEKWNDENYQGKYIYLYMGFGNGLCIDKTIYNDFKPYLDREKEKHLESYSEKDKKDLQYDTIFNVWDTALINMAKEKNIILK